MIQIKNLEHFVSKKILLEEEIVKQADILKKEGKKIGLCIGGYDLIHPGHMKHLDSAKKLCDILVVGITADSFNSERKGTGRPIYNENLRAYSISQLGSVDLVFISNYKGAIEAITAIRPNFYIKGPDYVQKQTPGIISEREAIESVDGEIKYTLDEKLSTTEIIDYIKNEIQ